MYCTRAKIGIINSHGLAPAYPFMKMLNPAFIGHPEITIHQSNKLNQRAEDTESHVLACLFPSHHKTLRVKMENLGNQQILCENALSCIP